MSRRNPKNKDLKRHTHKGKRARTNVGAGFSAIHNPRGIKGTGLRADPRLTATAMTRISPTPNGPEPRLP